MDYISRQERRCEYRGELANWDMVDAATFSSKLVDQLQEIRMPPFGTNLTTLIENQ